VAHLPFVTALILLVLTLPICIWVAWSDLRTMKIPNKAVMTLLTVWLVAGFFLLPLNVWLWGWALGAITLVVGFVLHLLMGAGAGDVKFAAAMAPFFVQSDLRFNMGLAAACMMGALAAHRLMRALPAMRRATPDWASWTSGKYFPFGLALTGMLIFHLLVAVRA
jgi:prepilin peptidase CpaA